MSKLKFDTWENPDGTENFKCRAWVNFNGTGTVAIRAAGNLSSVVDNGTGDYTILFENVFPDANYSLITSTAGENSTNTASSNAFRDYDTSLTASSARVTTVNNTNSTADRDVSVAIFR